MYALSHVFRLFPRRTFVGFWYERTTGSLTSIQRQGENAKSCADHMDKEVANRRWDMWPPFAGHGWLQAWKLSALLKTVFHLQFVKCRKSFSYKYYQVLIYLYVYIHTYIYICIHLDRFWTPQPYVDSVETGVASSETSRPLWNRGNNRMCIHWKS